MMSGLHLEYMFKCNDNFIMRDTIYGLGIIGALIYYIPQAKNLVAGLLGVLKAVLWPAFIVYELLGHLGM